MHRQQGGNELKKTQIMSYSIRLAPTVKQQALSHRLIVPTAAFSTTTFAVALTALTVAWVYRAA